ncbi:SURF1 family protein [Parasulfitobacter algicola]|uniref:SURF1-like protein n=1 Tax=Parasulfitobacter algicola TaxID=2614809 RepID=A0ABX2IT03_9RHOB|nr:SURF1 family protein [Sulfitobacter algicola]NSX56043.1 SURF1 family protein [Sulfitobacter algicola]
MTRKIILPLLFGLAGTAVLLWLGVWQVQRMEWKQDILAQIDNRIGGTPVALPMAPNPETDTYLPVEVTGSNTGKELHVLVSTKSAGAGYRIISAFETTDGRRIMVDRGFVPTSEKNAARSTNNIKIQGNLHWPDEIDSYTPEPDISGNIWFARDVPTMADALNTEPVLVIARTTSATTPAVTPLPIDSAGIPNDHFEYAVTWFLLAAVWVGMTGVLLWRIRRGTE